MHACMHAYTHTHICIHAYIHTCTYTHTHADGSRRRAPKCHGGGSRYTYIHTYTHTHRWKHQEEDEEHPSAMEEAGRIVAQESVASGSILRGVRVWLR